MKTMIMVCAIVAGTLLLGADHQPKGKDFTLYETTKGDLGIIKNFESNIILSEGEFDTRREVTIATFCRWIRTGKLTFRSSTHSASVTYKVFGRIWVDGSKVRSEQIHEAIKYAEMRWPNRCFVAME